MVNNSGKLGILKNKKVFPSWEKNSDKIILLFPFKMEMVPQLDTAVKLIGEQKANRKGFCIIRCDRKGSGVVKHMVLSLISAF